jgi:hypothetical protein
MKLQLVNATYMDKYWIQMGYVDVSQFVVGMVLILKVWACHMTYLFHSIVSITEWLVIRINLDFSLICNIFITLSRFVFQCNNCFTNLWFYFILKCNCALFK